MTSFPKGEDIFKSIHLTQSPIGFALSTIQTTHEPKSEVSVWHQAKTHAAHEQVVCLTDWQTVDGGESDSSMLENEISSPLANDNNSCSGKANPVRSGLGTR